MLNLKIFRPYDIRGMDEDDVEMLGKRSGENNSKHCQKEKYLRKNYYIILLY